MSFWRGAWRRAISGAIGGASVGLGGNILLGAMEGALTGLVDAALFGDNIGNAMLWGAGSGATFAVLTSENRKNLMKGKGFYNNDKILSNFREGKYSIPAGSTRQQETLNYFGFEGTYNPNIKYAAQFDPSSKSIHYNNKAFNENFDYLKSLFFEEKFHSMDYLKAQKEAPSKVFDLHAYEEWRAQKYLYFNQGYPKSNVNWIERINIYGRGSEMYEVIIDNLVPSKQPQFYSKWYHSIYKIPRRW